MLQMLKKNPKKSKPKKSKSFPNAILNFSMEQSLLDNRIHLDALRNTLAKHQVEKAYLFGSILTQKFDNQSDIDILVRFRDNLSPLEKGDLWWSLHDTLRDLYKREIDIVTENSLKNPYFINELNRTKKLVYHSK